MLIPSKLELILALKANPNPNPNWILAKFQISHDTLDQMIRTFDNLNLSILNYQWHGCFSPIDVANLKNMLIWENIDVDYRLSIPSTHLYLKEDKKQRLFPILCIAEHQSSGIGQRQKKWASPFGNNLYFSFKMNTLLRPQELSGLSLVTALSMLKALKIPELKIKWPNDIYIDDEKLAGILIDLGQGTAEGMSLIISIGINVNQMDKLALNNKWTSLQKIKGKVMDRTLILVQILNQLKLDMTKFEGNGFQAFLAEWQCFDALYQQEVMVTQGDKIIYGKALGVDQFGRLLLEDKKGYMMQLNFGQASIKPQR